MPELPEVETVRRGLVPALEGHVILRAETRRPDLRWPLPDRMAERLTGARVDRLRRRSKYILADLSTGETLLIHLGMSGRMLVSGMTLGSFHQDVPALGKHDHVVIESGAGARIVFNDARRFGAMDLMATDRSDDHWLLRGLGPEPFGNDFHGDYLASRLAGRRAPIKALLLDQRVIAGLGNIYVCEVLHRAAIAPDRAASSLGPEMAARLATLVREVLAEAIEAGGSSLRDHRRTDGELGYFQHNFRVYGREGEPCATPGCNGVVTRIVQSGRSSFFCRQCQR